LISAANFLTNFYSRIMHGVMRLGLVVSSLTATEETGAMVWDKYVYSNVDIRSPNLAHKVDISPVQKLRLDSAPLCRFGVTFSVCVWFRFVRYKRNCPTFEIHSLRETPSTQIHFVDSTESGCFTTTDHAIESRQGIVW
jgi:hypothetical protein